MSDPPLSFEALFRGRAEAQADLSLHLSCPDGLGLAAKLRQAYYWIVNNAIIVPHYDITFDEGGGLSHDFPNGDRFLLPRGPAWSSYVLLPLLTFATGRRALLVGGPGRGKTATALLMGLLAGYTEAEVKRAVQHGHPQLTIADLIGNPLPADLLSAQDMDEIRIAWRRWITMRVKIVDEYNRIPTRTQSALLSLMSEGYAELLGQTVEAGHGAWFLTANDDAGGGTFQVIEALKDRIDVTIRTMTFNSRFLGRLLERLEADRSPAEMVPTEIIFTEAEMDAMRGAIRSTPFDSDALRRLEFFVGSLDFCQRAAADFEAKSKDTLKLAGVPLHTVCNEDCPLDKTQHICSQTVTGLSVRSYQTLMDFAKALAFFRGSEAVRTEDVRQVLPYVLHEKLNANAQGDFFTDDRHQVHLRDKVAWIRQMWDRSMAQFDGSGRRTKDPGRGLLVELDAGLDGVPRAAVETRMRAVEKEIARLCKGGELSAPVYEDLVRLKYIYLRYQNYLRWLVQAKDA